MLVSVLPSDGDDCVTKKALVRFDPKKPNRSSSDFLAPIRDESGTTALASLTTGKVAEYGLVVYAGRSVTPDAMFKKLVGSRQQIDSVENTLADFEACTDQVSSLKIGSVVQLVADTDVTCGFALQQTDFKLGGHRPRLP